MQKIIFFQIASGDTDTLNDTQPIIHTFKERRRQRNYRALWIKSLCLGLHKDFSKYLGWFWKAHFQIVTVLNNRMKMDLDVGLKRHLHWWEVYKVYWQPYYYKPYLYELCFVPYQFAQLGFKWWDTQYSKRRGFDITSTIKRSIEPLMLNSWARPFKW